MTPPDLSSWISEARVDADRARILAACGRALSQPRHGALRDRLRRLARQAEAVWDLDRPVDAYGDGVVAELERRTAERLGKPACVFFPTGIMAQQVALRLWAARKETDVVAVHGLAHTEQREMGALRAVAGLRPLVLTNRPRPIVTEDVRRAPTPFAALVLELPLRDAGFVLPDWAALLAVCAAARERGAAVHFDGARLWETTVGLGRSLAEIAALADSVYVSFYKALGGLSGAALACDAEMAVEARDWRLRHGGLQFQQFPVALAALHGLGHEFPRLEGYVRHARRVAAALEAGFAEAGLEARITPRPPHTHQFQLRLPGSPEALDEAGLRLAQAGDVALFAPWRAVAEAGWAMTEVTVAASAMDWSGDEVARAAVAFAGHVRAVSPIIE